MKTQSSSLRGARRTLRHAATVAALLVAGAASASAGDWKWTVTPYLWATDVGVDVAIDDRQVVDETIAFEDLVESVEAAAQLRIEAQRGAHGVMLDIFDVRLAEDPATLTLPSGAGEATISAEIGMSIVEAAGIYDPHGDQQGFALLYGARLLDQRAEIDARFDLTSGSTVSREFEPRDTLVDGMVGVRYTRRFAQRWSHESRVDVSAGGTELTWSAGSSLAYAFGKTGRYAVSAGYRRMVVDFKDDDATEVDMTLSGFVTGLRVAF